MNTAWYKNIIAIKNGSNNPVHNLKLKLFREILTTSLSIALDKKQQKYIQIAPNFYVYQTGVNIYKNSYFYYYLCSVDTIYLRSW